VHDEACVLSVVDENSYSGSKGGDVKRSQWPRVEHSPCFLAVVT
jgi:hypothetical protein